MADIITRLRRMVFDINSEIWTDDNLEDLLDQYRIPIRRELLSKNVVEKIYYSAYTILEGDSSSWTGDPTIALWSDPTDSATEVDPDSWNLIDGSFVFTTSRDNDYYLDAWSYRRALHMAASDCFEEGAADPSTAAVWGRGGVYHSSTPPMQLAQIHRSRAGARSSKIVRVRR